MNYDFSTLQFGELWSTNGKMTSDLQS